jgi:hypothetical protein
MAAAPALFLDAELAKAANQNILEIIQMPLGFFRSKKEIETV